jgi:hypothetical protein
VVAGAAGGGKDSRQLREVMGGPMMARDGKAVYTRRTEARAGPLYLQIEAPVACSQCIARAAPAMVAALQRW